MKDMSRGELLWEGYRFVLGPPNESELVEMVEMAWQAAGEQCGLIDALDQFEWLPDIVPVAAWNKYANWESLIRALADLVRCAIEGDE